MAIIVIKNPTAGLQVPLTGLVLWYGTSSQVPAGWTIYSTANGNLVMGAFSGAKNLTPAGSNTHVHTNSTSGGGGGHDHATSGGTIGSGAGQEAFGSGVNVASSGHTHSITDNPAAAGTHTHSVSNSDSANSLPPYHRLYWIERTT